MDEEYVFPGFIFPAPKGHTQIPNTWYDEIISQIDNVAELKIVLYILRHTCGFQKPEEAQRLTVDEIMHGRIFSGKRIDRGTGLSEMSVRNGLKSAIKHGYIVCEHDASDKSNFKKCYKLRFSGVQSLDPQQELGVQSLDPTGTNSVPLGVQSLGVRGTKFVPDSPGGVKEKERKLKESRKESDSSLHSFNLSSESLETVRKFAEMYGDNDPVIHQELAQRIYQRYDISDNEFHDYLYHAQVASNKTKRMSDFFDKLQKMLEDR